MTSSWVSKDEHELIREKREDHAWSLLPGILACGLHGVSYSEEFYGESGYTPTSKQMFIADPDSHIVRNLRFTYFLTGEQPI